MQVLFLILGIAVVASPALLLGMIGLSSLLNLRLGEAFVARLTQLCIWCGILPATTILILMLVTGVRHVPIDLGDWVAIPDEHFHFHLKLIFDRLSVPLVILSFALCGVVSAFTTRYLHRDTGFHRFFLCYAIFLLGMVVSTVAGPIEVLFFSWELVGLSSALLVAYFHERSSPVRNGLRVWSVYRISDAAFLVAAVLLHSMTGGGEFDKLSGTGVWPDVQATLSSHQALAVGLLLLIAAAGKSALVPFSEWLPRAMEGPTPSSAVFYGALSVHLGAYLLLRVSPILNQSILLSGLVTLVGITSAVYGALTARVQCDVKSALAFASLTQVGLIVAEIGCGLRYIPLIHIIGHASLRTLQLLRAPTLLRDYHSMENAVGRRLSSRAAPAGGGMGLFARGWWYRFSLERGYFDAVLTRFLAEPFLQVFRACDGWERKWCRWLSGGDVQVDDPSRRAVPRVEEGL